MHVPPSGSGAGEMGYYWAPDGSLLLHEDANHKLKNLVQAMRRQDMLRRRRGCGVSLALHGLELVHFVARVPHDPISTAKFERTPQGWEYHFPAERALIPNICHAHRRVCAVVVHMYGAEVVHRRERRLRVDRLARALVELFNASGTTRGVLDVCVRHTSSIPDASLLLLRKLRNEARVERNVVVCCVCG